MLSIWRIGNEARRTTHVPVYVDDAARNARAGATPAPHRGERPQDTAVPRNRANGR
jgi:hypothetical protein